MAAVDALQGRPSIRSEGISPATMTSPRGIQAAAGGSGRYGQCPGGEPVLNAFRLVLPISEGPCAGIVAELVL